MRYKCIRDYVECADIIRDSLTGRLFGTKFVKIFVKGEDYQPLKISETETTFQNEQGGITSMNNKILCNFFELNKR